MTDTVLHYIDIIKRNITSVVTKPRLFLTHKTGVLNHQLFKLIYQNTVRL